MSRIRFASAVDVFAAYSTVAEDVGQPACDLPPLDFLKQLTGLPQPRAAVAFLAYLLPKREAVWWGCRTVRALSPGLSDNEESAILAAEGWVREPTEERRRLAVRAFFESAETGPGHWCALAAGRSSGNLAQTDTEAFPVEPFMSARNVMIAVLAVGGRVQPEVYAERVKICVRAGAEFAAGGQLAL